MLSEDLELIFGEMIGDNYLLIITIFVVALFFTILLKGVRK